MSVQKQRGVQLICLHSTAAALLSLKPPFSCPAHTQTLQASSRGEFARASNVIAAIVLLETQQTKAAIKGLSSVPAVNSLAIVRQ